MSSLDVQQAVKIMKEHRKKVTETREKAVEFLVRAGIISKNNNQLSQPYG